MMERIGGDVRRELGRFGPPDGNLADIVRAWPGAVGETVARNAWPARLARDGTLHVNAVSSTWAFELGRLAGTVLAQLRSELGDATPPALKVAPGPVPEPEPEPPAKASADAPRPGPEHVAEATRLAAAIEDEELRETVARAAAASLARGASKGAEAPSDGRRFW